MSEEILSPKQVLDLYWVKGRYPIDPITPIIKMVSKAKDDDMDPVLGKLVDTATQWLSKRM